MKEHPTDTELLKEGTQTTARPVVVAKTLLVGFLADLATVAGRLWRRLRR
jgi:hypothetical protein